MNRRCAISSWRSGVGSAGVYWAFTLWQDNDSGSRARGQISVEEAKAILRDRKIARSWAILILRNSFLRLQTDSLVLCANKSRSEGCYVEDDHDESKEIHSHHEPDPEVHSANANQPNLSRLAVPDKKWISDFQQTNKNPIDRDA